MISVILIASNASAWIDRSIQSVLASTYHDWEMVVVDNGSTDNTREIAQRYADNDLRIKVHTIPHTTLGGARHTGVKLAKHQWFTFVNATDTIEPHALEWLVDHIPDEDMDVQVGAIVGGIRCYDSNGSYAVRGNFSGLLSTQAFIEGMLRGDFTAIFGGKLLRRAAYAVNPSYLDAEVEFAHELIALSAKIQHSKDIYINTSEYIYNFHPELLDKPGSFNFRGWLKAAGALQEFVPDGEAFFRYRLNQLYDGCITTGSIFPSNHHAIKKLRADSSRYALDKRDRHILNLTRYKTARKRVSNKITHRSPDATTLISVVLVVNNASDIIHHAIDSVRNQTFKDWELIVVDNFSTDTTSSIVRSIAATDPRIRLISTSRKSSRGECRILGVNLAKGDYIGFINPEDSYAPRSMEKLWGRVFATGADVVIMGSALVSSHGLIKIPIFNPEDVFDQPLVSQSEVLALMLSGAIPYRQCDRIYKRSAVRLSEHTTEDIIDDAIFNVRVLRNKAEVAWTDYTGFLWHPVKMLRTPYPELLARDLEGFKRINALAKEENWPEQGEIRHHLQHGLVHYFLNFVTLALSQSWREGAKRMILDALEDREIVEALNTCGISPDLGSVLQYGRIRYRKNRRFIRKYRLIEKLL